MQWDPKQCCHELTKPRDTVDGLTDTTLVKGPSHQRVCARFRQSMRLGLGVLSLYKGGGVAQRGQEGLPGADNVLVLHLGDSHVCFYFVTTF